jgi:hypothetical protein
LKAAVQAELERAQRIEPPPADGVVLTCGADLRPEPVAWLWPGWLALGKLHVKAGAPGTGKTTIAMDLTAPVTTGGWWPDGTRCELPGNCLVWSGEDDAADTLLPRALAAGANPKRLFFISGTRIAGELSTFDPARDMAELQAQAERIGNVRLIIVDPIVSAVTGDSHKNTEVRRALQPLVDLAASLKAALVGITHFSKGGQGTDPATRVLGSVAFTAVARVVLVAAKITNEDGEDRRVLARGKSNIGPDDGGITYTLAQCEPLPGIQASRVLWGEQVKGSARELLAEPADQSSEDDAGMAGETARTNAAHFLREALAGGPTPARTIEAEARSAGLAWRTVRRAADHLGVIRRKGLGDSPAWYWSLPTDAKVAKLSNLSTRENVDTLDTLATPSATDQHRGAE